MGEVVALLERKGMVSRIEDDSNRKVLILSLTEAGLAATRAGDEVVDKLETSMFGSLPKKEIVQFRETLHKLLAQFRAE
jgi:DNA-binding MarR family transcriptional regulator